MKRRILVFILFSLIGCGVGKSTTLSWANTNGGDWNIATNWTPNQVPVSGDNVIITNSGTYTVTNYSSATLGSFILGGTNGIQTVILSSLTLSGAGNVGSNGVVYLGGVTINGSLTLGQGSVLYLTNNTTYSIFGPLTNNGTVNWLAGSLYGYGPPTYTGLIYNTGLWNAQFDGTLTVGGGTPAFINTGTFRKSGGTGTTAINWNFTSTGSFDTQTGSFSGSTWVSNSIVHGTYTGGITLYDTNATLLVASNAVVNWNGGSLYGSMTVGQGGVLNLTNNTTYSLFSTFTNNGTVNWSAGVLSGYGPPTYTGLIYNTGLWNAQFDGTLSPSSGTPLFINTGTFRKSAGTGTTAINWDFTSTGIFDTQTGSFSGSTWVSNSVVHGIYTGGITLIDTNATLLVASNAVINWNSGSLYGYMTVAQGGVLNLTNNTTWGIYVKFTNNGTVNWSLGNIYGYGPPTYTGLIYNAGLWNVQFDGTLSAGSGTPLFINTGTFRKSGGNSTTTISWNFTSTGIFDTQTGQLSSSTWVSNSIVNGTYTGTVTINDTNATVLVASNAVVNWNSGSLYGSMTVAQGGVLNLTNNTTWGIYTTFTNNGTVNWSVGSIYGYGPPTYNGLIYNTGLWNAQFDGTFTAASGTPAFINTGIFRKSGGTGTTTMNWNFTSTGFFDVQTGLLAINAGVGNSVFNGNFSGPISIETNSTATIPANTMLNWSSGTIAAGGAFNIASNAVVNCGGGSIYGSLTVVQGGVLSLTNNTTYAVYGTVTNNGTVNWSLGSLYGYGPSTYTGLIYNAGLWNMQFDGTFTAASGTPLFINTGTFRKSGGTGTTTISWNFTSTGIFDTQTGQLSSSTWVSNSIAHGTYTGTITLNDTNASLLVASNAVINWNNGSIYSSLTVGQGGVLNLTNNTTWGIYGALTNNGTVNWSLGSVYGYGPPTYTGLIYNTGLWNAQFGGTLTPASGTPAFINTGIFRKTAGNSTTTVNWAFTNNLGTVDSQTNNITLSGSYNLNGGTLNVGIYNLTNYGVITLSGAAPLTGTVSANLNNGYIPIGGNAFTNILYGSFTGLFTNAALPFADAWSTNYHTTFFVLNVLNARPVIVAPVTNLFVVNELTTLNDHAQCHQHGHGCRYSGANAGLQPGGRDQRHGRQSGHGRPDLDAATDQQPRHQYRRCRGDRQRYASFERHQYLHRHCEGSERRAFAAGDFYPDRQ
jgi:hypothetical protein